MLKRIFVPLLVVISAICGNTLRAQSYDSFNSASPSPYWGVRAALDLNLPGDWHGASSPVKMFRSGYGFSVGAIYNVPFATRFYFEPGMSLYYDTYSYDNLIITDADGNLNESDPGLRKFGVRVPLVVGMVFPLTDSFTLNVFTGPELNYGLIGKIHLKDASRFEDEFPTDLYDGYHRRFNFAWKVGVAFPIDPWVVSVEGSFGISDLMAGDISFREHRVSVGLGYNF